MNIQSTRYDDVAVLTIRGDLNTETVDSFKEQLEQCETDGLVYVAVDCSELEALDSIGLEELLDAQDRCENRHGGIKLCGMDETLLKILEITRLQRRFETFESLDAAVKSFT